MASESSSISSTASLCHSGEGVMVSDSSQATWGKAAVRLSHDTGRPGLLGEVGGDAEQPGAEPVGRTEPVDGELRAQEHLLHEVLSGDGVAHEAPAEALEGDAMLRDEAAERFPVAILGSADEVGG